MTLQGIDISHWQTGLQLGKTGLDFAIIKATEGTSYVDSECNRFVSQAKNAGMLWGTYHFAHTGSDAEADHYLQTIENYIGHGIMVLDWEADAVDRGPDAAANWLHRVHDRTGIWPVLYASQSVVATQNWSAVAKDVALWVARYSTEIGPTGAWKSPLMWQYTSSGRVNGWSGGVDLNHFYGDRATWDAFATGSNRDTSGTGTDGGDDMTDVWAETISKWAPESTPNEGEQITMGKQLNQARGYAEDAWDRTVKIESKVDSLSKKVDQLIAELGK